MSQEHASDLAIRADEPFVEDAPNHRRRTIRQARHTAKEQLHLLAGDEEGLEDADLVCPKSPHDLGRKSSPKRKGQPKPGRRSGFKVWKTPFWKRRRALWAKRNAEHRRIVEEA